MTTVRFKRVCAGIYHSAEWFQLPADDRGFAQHVHVAVRKSRGTWTVSVEHVNELGRAPYARSEHETAKEARVAAVALLMSVEAKRSHKTAWGGSAS